MPTKLISVSMLFFAAAATLSAQPTGFQSGDVVITGQRIVVDPFDPEATVALHDRGGAFIKYVVSLPRNTIGGAAFGKNGTLYVASNLTLQSLLFDGSQSIVAGGIYAMPENVVPALDGSIYVGTLLSPEVLHLSSSGAILMTLRIPGAASASRIDLDSDQCTLFFLDGNTLGRFDVCSERLLPPVRTDMRAGRGGYVRILPSGDLLTLDASGLRRISRAGVVVHDYAGGGPLALDPTGTAVWVATSTALVKLDVESGAILAGPIPLSFETVYSVAVVREARAALSAPASIPVFSPIAVALLAIALATVAVVRGRPGV